jgi:hypothetical protein
MISRPSSSCSLDGTPFDFSMWGNFKQKLGINNLPTSETWHK